MKKPFWLVGIVFLFAMLCCNNAMAKPRTQSTSSSQASSQTQKTTKSKSRHSKGGSATGWDGMFALDVPIVRLSTKAGGQSNTVDDPWAGIGVQLIFGYRWKYAGVYLDEHIDGIWWTGPGDASGSFLGGTYVVGRGYIPFYNKFEAFGGFGLGMMYSGGDNGLIRTNSGENTGCFALKFTFGATYRIITNVRIGLHLDYNLGIAVNNTGGNKVTTYYHNINLGPHVAWTF